MAEAERRNQCYQRLLGALDLAVAFTLLPVAVILCWRGLWQLVDVALMRQHGGSDGIKDKLDSVSISLPVGLVVSVAISVGQYHISKVLQKWLDGSKSRVLSFVLSRTFILIMTVTGVVTWRGVWYLLDVLLAVLALPQPGQAGFLVLVLLLSFLATCWPAKISRSLLSSPLQASNDSITADIFEPPTLFGRRPPGLGSYRHPSNSSWPLFILDSLASSVVVHCLVITCWWAAWTLYDQLPASPYSLHIYLACGYTGCMAAYFLQLYVLQKYGPKPLCMDLIVFLGLMGNVCLWHGLWDASDTALSVTLSIHDRTCNLAVQTLIGYVVLVMTNSSSLAGSRGVLRFSQTLPPGVPDCEWDGEHLAGVRPDNCGEIDVATSPLSEEHEPLIAAIN